MTRKMSFSAGTQQELFNQLRLHNDFLLGFRFLLRPQLPELLRLALCHQRLVVVVQHANVTVAHLCCRLYRITIRRQMVAAEAVAQPINRPKEFRFDRQCIEPLSQIYGVHHRSTLFSRRAQSMPPACR